MDQRENYTLAHKFNESFRIRNSPKPALAIKIIAQRLAKLGAFTMEPWGAGCRIREKRAVDAGTHWHSLYKQAQYCLETGQYDQALGWSASLHEFLTQVRSRRHCFSDRRPLGLLRRAQDR